MKNKYWAFFLFASFVMVGFSSYASAESGRKVKFFGQVEYWTTADAFEENEKELDDLYDVVSPFFPIVDKSYEVDPGMGIRFGALVPLDNFLLIGGSLGYIVGPKNTLSLYMSDNVDYARLNYEQETKFIRALVESRVHIGLSDKVGMRLGVGLGVARGSTEGTAVEDSSFFGSDRYSASKNWTGFTWEITPSILFNTGKSNIELGLAIAGFPKLKENDDFSKFEWTPIGIRLGVEF